MKDYNEFVAKLQEIKDMGWIKTHRRGNTGIGKTLEDLLGITENNVPGPNAMGWLELKSTRQENTNMITLFTKAPKPNRANTRLRNNFGYVTEESQDQQILHSTVNALSFNTLRRGKGFKIEIDQDRLNLIDPNDNISGYWDKTILQTTFESKCPNLMFVKARSRSFETEEEFFYNEAWALARFGFDNFVHLVESGKILVDIRLGIYSDGRPHDHGTAFRVLELDLDMCYGKRVRVL